MKLPGLPNRLRWARTRAGFARQIDAAVALGLSQQNVSDLETGKRGLSIQRLMQIATVYGCTTDYLLGLTPKTGRMITPKPPATAVPEDEVDRLWRADGPGPYPHHKCAPPPPATAVPGDGALTPDTVPASRAVELNEEAHAWRKRARAAEKALSNLSAHRPAS